MDSHIFQPKRRVIAQDRVSGREPAFFRLTIRQRTKDPTDRSTTSTAVTMNTGEVGSDREEPATVVATMTGSSPNRDPTGELPIGHAGGTQHHAHHVPRQNRDNAQEKGEEKLAAPFNFIDAGDFFIFFLQAVHQILARKAADAVGDGDTHQQAGQIDQKGSGRGNSSPAAAYSTSRGKKTDRDLTGVGRQHRQGGQPQVVRRIPGGYCPR